MVLKTGKPFVKKKKKKKTSEPDFDTAMQSFAVRGYKEKKKSK